jgi:hypothetical protein
MAGNRFCTHCGAHLSLTARFCGQCGAGINVSDEWEIEEHSPRIARPGSEFTRGVEEGARATNRAAGWVMGASAVGVLTATKAAQPAVVATESWLTRRAAAKDIQAAEKAAQLQLANHAKARKDAETARLADSYIRHFKTIRSRRKLRVSLTFAVVFGFLFAAGSLIFGDFKSSEVKALTGFSLGVGLLAGWVGLMAADMSWSPQERAAHEAWKEMRGPGFFGIIGGLWFIAFCISLLFKLFS